jgi:mono/diheme cytochrome c family protein
MQLTRKFILVGLIAIGFVLPSLVSAANNGASIFDDSCSGCHNASSRPLDKIHLTKEQWKETVERMVSMGADIPSGKKLELLLDYLVSKYGPTGTATDKGSK